MTEKNTIVILGSEIAAPMTAAYLGRHLPREKFDIFLIDPGALSRTGWSCTTHPDIRRFNRALNIGEAAFIKATKASFKLGDQYRNELGTSFYNTFGDIGIDVDGVGFHHHLMRLGDPSELANFNTYTLSAMAAQAGKFLLPDAKGQQVLSDYDYGYHMDPDLYAALLLRKAIEFGVHHIPMTSVEFEQKNGRLTKVTIDGDKTFEADLYINCSGGSDINGLPKRSFHSWSKWCPGRSYRTTTKPPQNSHLGLVTQINVQKGGYSLFASNQVDDRSIEFYEDATVGDHTYECGQCDENWTGNILHLGSAAATIEPTLGLTLRAVQLDLERFLKLFPGDLQNPIEQHEYNRLTSNMYTHVRDYFALQNGGNPLPKSAQLKLNIFKARGELSMSDDDDILKGHWLPMLLGQGIRPEKYSLLANETELDSLKDAIKSLLDLIEQTVEKMPSCEAFIARQCPAEGFAYNHG